MFFGIRQLRRARDLLGASGRPGDRELAEAMLSFRAACDFRPDWPGPFRERADEIRRLVTADGSIAATAAGMSDATVAAFREKVRAFVADAEGRASGRDAGAEAAGPWAARPG